MNFKDQCKEDLFAKNPISFGLLGLCMALNVTTSVKSGFGVGIFMLALLALSNLTISLLRRVIPSEVSLLCDAIVIGGLTTAMTLLLQSFWYDAYCCVGAFAPLVAANGLLFDRAEHFAREHGVWASVSDGVSKGVACTVLLVILSVVREFLGNGTVFALRILPRNAAMMEMMLVPAGGLLCLGALAAAVRWIRGKLRGGDARWI